MNDQLPLRRKYVFRAGGRQIVLIKKRNESEEHVLTKAILWALYQNEYPSIQVEIPIEDRYKPDLVAFDDEQSVSFWAESGKVSLAKMRAIFRRYPRTHFAFARWRGPIKPYKMLVQQALGKRLHKAPIDLIALSDESIAQALQADGQLTPAWEVLDWTRIPGAT